MKNLTWQNPEQLFVAQELINKVKSKCCGIKDNLRLIFNSDMTFSLSFSVPFMADTVGTWKVGGMDEWNEIVYHNGIIDQLGEFDDGDTIIYINSPTPQKTYKKPTLIDKVFFVRIK